MAPNELRDIAAGHVSIVTDKDNKEEVVISQEKVTLSPHNAGQLNELVGKLKEKGVLEADPVVERLSKAGAVKVQASTLVEIIDLANRSGVSLDDPE